MTQSVSPKLVAAEVVRFSIEALHRKIEELKAAEGADSPADALAAISQALATDSLLGLAEPCQRIAEGLPLYAGSTAEAVAGFGTDADALRAMLAGHEAAAAE